MTTAETIEGVASDLGLTMTTVFVPWSQSRNAGEETPSLNWKVTLHKDGKAFLTTDYMAGMGHCPASKRPVSELGHSRSVMRMERIDRECETGHSALAVIGSVRESMGMPIRPAFADVLYSLVSDEGALDYADFEAWATDAGYDTDSRQAEAIYKASVEIALKMRAAIGNEGMATLRDVITGY